MLIEAAKIGDIARGGMQLVKVGQIAIALCNCDGEYHAISRECGHLNGPLEMGALDGTILSCPLHHVQYDVTSGEALNFPIQEYSEEPHETICDIRTYPVIIEEETIKIQVD